MVLLSLHTVGRHDLTALASGGAVVVSLVLGTAVVPAVYLLYILRSSWFMRLVFVVVFVTVVGIRSCRKRDRN